MDLRTLAAISTILLSFLEELYIWRVKVLINSSSLCFVANFSALLDLTATFSGDKVQFSPLFSTFSTSFFDDFSIGASFFAFRSHKKFSISA